MKKMIKKIMTILLVMALVMNAVIPVCASEIPEDIPDPQENEVIVAEEGAYDPISDADTDEIIEVEESAEAAATAAISGNSDGEDTVLEELNDSKESLEDKKPGTDYNENEAVVIAKTRSEALKAARQYNGTLKSYEYGVGVIDLRKPYTETVEEILDTASLASIEEVDNVTPDVTILPQIYLHTAEIPSEVSVGDPYDHWQHAKINDSAMWSQGFFGSGTKVCVIDSGISTSSEVYPKVADSIDFTNSSVEDSFGHGTHVAGIVAAPADNRGIVGVAPQASLYIAKVGSGGNDILLSSVFSAIEWAIRKDVDIINISLGGLIDDNATIDHLNNYMLRCRNNGIMPVVAACNYATDIPYYPAACDYVISVGATDINDSLADFSNYGDWVDIAAPGDGIYSTTTGTSYDRLGGTSQAAPVVTGALALLHSTSFVSDTDDSAEYYQMKNRLRAVRTGTTYSFSGTYNGRYVNSSVRGGLNLTNFRGDPGEDFPDIHYFYSDRGSSSEPEIDDNDYYDEKTGTLVKIDEDEKYTKLSGGDTSALLIIKKEILYTRSKKAIASAVCAKLTVLEGHGLSIRSVKAKKPKKNANYTTVTIKLRGSDKASKKTAKAMNKQLKRIYISLKSPGTKN